MPVPRLDEHSLRIPFNGSPRPTLGVELELQLIDPRTMNLTSASPQIFERLGESDRIKQELTQSTVEVITGVCDNVREVRADLTASMRKLYEVTDEIGVAISSAGTHPFAQWREQQVFPNERYSHLVERIQWPARRLLIYGLHVHVGISSGEKAIAIGNALTTYLPHVLALSASSPFVDYEDTGLASARSKIFEGMPTAGLPYRLANWGEFQKFMNALIRADAIQSVREIWWDIRPHPNFGTIEVRVCDCPSTLWETCALTALIQCLVVYLDHLYDEGVDFPLLQPWIVRENKWRAVRFGLDADIINDNTGQQRPLRDDLDRLLDALDEWADGCGCRDELHLVRRMLEEGPSYERQRRLYDEHRSFLPVIQQLTRDLRDDVFSGVDTPA